MEAITAWVILRRDRVMLRITISRSGEPPRTNSYDKREITVGRTPSNDLMISEPGVSSAHARILNMDGALTIIDLESTNGTFVNGQRIRGPHIIQPHDEVYICAHKLQFDLGMPGASPRSPGPSGPPYGGEASPPAWPPPHGPSAPMGPPMGPPGGLGPPPMAPMAPMGGHAPAPPPSIPPPIGAAPAPAAPSPYPSAPPPPVGPPMASPPMPPASMRGAPAPPPPAPAPPPPMGMGEPPRLAVPSPVGVGGPMRANAAAEPPTLPPMLGAIGTSDTQSPPGHAPVRPRAAMPLSVPPPPPEPIAPELPQSVEPSVIVSAPPPAFAPAPPPPASAPPPPVSAAPPPLSVPPPIGIEPPPASIDAPPSIDSELPPPLDDEPPAVLEPVNHHAPAPPSAPPPPPKQPAMPAVTADRPAPSSGSAVTAQRPRPRAVASTPPGMPDEPAPVPVRSGATMFADDVLATPSEEADDASATRSDSGRPRPTSSRRSGVIESKPSGPTSPGLAPPPRPPTESGSRDASPPQGLARPAPVSPLQHSAPLSLVSDASLGRPEDLAGLDPDEQLREACARVFAVAHDRIARGSAEAPDDLRDQIRGDLQIFAEHHRHIDVDAWTPRIVDELFALGPLDALLADAEVREVFVHGPDRVLARRGQTGPRSTGATFSCPQAIEVVVRRLTRTLFGVDNPVVDARTSGGQDVYAVHETVAAGGPVVVVRIPGAHDIAYSLSHLVATGAMTPNIAQLLDACVLGGLNIAICAGPGAQAFPLLAAFAEAAPEEHRQLVVRPSHEPGLLPANAVVLEGSGLVGTEGASVMQALVRTAMGLAPDRLLVHDLAGPEVADVLAAMGRGLQGSVVTLRASSTSAGLSRLGTLVGLAGGSADVSTRTLHAAQAIDVMVAVSRFADGQTRVTQVSEPSLSPTGAPITVDLVTIDPQTRNWTHTGVIPTFAQDLQRRGIRVDFGA